MKSPSGIIFTLFFLLPISLNTEIQNNTNSDYCLLKWACSLSSWTKTAHTTAGREPEVQGFFQRLIVCTGVSGTALKPCWHGQQVQCWSDMAETSPAKAWVRSSSLLASNSFIRLIYANFLGPVLGFGAGVL